MSRASGRALPRERDRRVHERRSAAPSARLRGHGQALADIFSFFTKPSVAEFRPLRRLEIIARGAGLEVKLVGGELVVGFADFSGLDWSHGEIRSGKTFDAKGRMLRLRSKFRRFQETINS